MNPPDIFVEILKLFPGLGVGLVIGWYGLRTVGRAHEAHVTSMKEDQAKHLATKDAIIVRLETEIETLRKERDKWLREAMGKKKP